MKGLIKVFNKLFKSQMENQGEFEVGMVINQKTQTTNKYRIYAICDELISMSQVGCTPSSVTWYEKSWVRANYNVPVPSFKPTDGDRFYFVDVDGLVRSRVYSDESHKGMVRLGNCFRTANEAKAGRERISKVIRGE